ncbi:hypothetical protein OG410_32945 [Streptomyces sp. NBC_00659]|nr:hypothetical protein [Streptomyces sp. NBC_00659]
MRIDVHVPLAPAPILAPSPVYGTATPGEPVRRMTPPFGDLAHPATPPRR